MGDRQQERPYRRVGDTAKCPACGVPTDPGAYRCPRCLIYFCFKCRRRVQQRDEQFQCMNQQCDQYGKMLCNTCIVEVPVMDDRSRDEMLTVGVPEYDEPRFSLKQRLLTSLACSVGASACVFFSGGERWSIAVWGGCGAAICAWVIAAKVHVPAIPPTYRTVQEKMVVGKNKSCIACRQPVQHLSGDF